MMHCQFCRWPTDPCSNLCGKSHTQILKDELKISKEMIKLLQDLVKKQKKELERYEDDLK